MLKWIFASLVVANLVAATVISLEMPHEVYTAPYEFNAHQASRLAPSEAEVVLASAKPTADAGPAPADTAKTGEAAAAFPADTPAGKAADKPADAPVASGTDKPADKAAEKPAEKPATAGKVADKPVEKPADKPAAKAEKTADSKPAVPRVCLALGAFGEQDVASVRAALGKQGLKAKESVSETGGRPTGKHWVYLPPAADRAAANTRSLELKGKGFDNYVVANEPNKNALSLGLFSQESAARAFVAKLSAAGITGADIESRGKGIKQTRFLLDGLEPAEAGAVRKIAGQWPKASLQTRRCQ
ncbi:sporulation related protein [Microvirgula sp. AG722]|uniref:SPOR domain-containing protein n=1 Tax=Microvirgula sp. AG722 TaxID=2183901 RepID=UPI000DC5B738|nr:SPOR domain-containing protein [Microvirgula sp. AG722]RAS14292.1 sporulation related protein [Microvirgula sp. AG722]